MDAYWRAANYLSVGQIYLLDNPLLTRAAPPRPHQAAPARPLGHDAGPQLHLRPPEPDHQAARPRHDLRRRARPRRTGARRELVPRGDLLASIYPDISQDEDGMRRLFKQFSFPGGIPSHVAPETPGSIHEGGELGLLARPRLRRGVRQPGPDRGVRGGRRRGRDRPARDELALEQVPEPGARRRGAAHPAPERLQDRRAHGARAHPARGAAARCSTATATSRTSSRAATPRRCISSWRPRSTRWWRRSGASRSEARADGFRKRAALADDRPAHAQGMDGPEGRGRQALGRHLARAPGADRRDAGPARAHEAAREVDEELPAARSCSTGADGSGPSSPRWRPRGSAAWARTRTPTAGCCCATCACPTSASTRSKVATAGGGGRRGDARAGGVPARRDEAERGGRNFRVFSPDETASNRWNAVFEASDRCSTAEISPLDENVSPDGRVMEILCEHMCQGWLEGYLLTGRHGFFSCYEAFIHIVDSMFNQHAKWLKSSRQIPWRRPIASLNYLLTSHVWRQDHNGFSHQDPGFIDHVVNKKADIIRVYLPPDANTLLSVTDHCLRSRHYVNVIVAGKQPEPQWLDMDAAVKHCTRGHRHLGVGLERPRRRAGRGDGLRGRRAHARDAGRGGPAAPRVSRSQGARGQRRRPDDPAARDASTRTASATRTSTSLFTPGQARSCSRSTATRR